MRKTSGSNYRMVAEGESRKENLSRREPDSLLTGSLNRADGQRRIAIPDQIEGKTLLPTRGWSTNADGVSRLKQANRLLLIGDSLRFIVYHDDFPRSFAHEQLDGHLRERFRK